MRKIFLHIVLATMVALTSCEDDDQFRLPPIDYSLYSAPTWNELGTTPASGLPSEQISRWQAANPEFPLEESSSGLLYHIIEEGSDVKPSSTDVILSYYRGTLVDGTRFDGTGTRPTEFAVNGVVQGFSEGLQLLGEGGRAIVLIRPDLGYGANGRNNTPITGSSVIIFQMTLEDVDARNNPIGG